MKTWRLLVAWTKPIQKQIAPEILLASSFEGIPEEKKSFFAMWFFRKAYSGLIANLQECICFINMYCNIILHNNAIIMYICNYMYIRCIYISYIYIFSIKEHFIYSIPLHDRFIPELLFKKSKSLLGFRNTTFSTPNTSKPQTRWSL